MSRKLSDLTPEAQEKARLFTDAMLSAGIRFAITCTYRSQEEQNELWDRGRVTPGPKVTWSRVSKHTSRTAFDIVILKDNKAIWDIVKTDVNTNNIPDYEEAGVIGEGVGLEWGGRWAVKDACHFQLKEAT